MVKEITIQESDEIQRRLNEDVELAEVNLERVKARLTSARKARGDFLSAIGRGEIVEVKS